MVIDFIGIKVGLGEDGSRRGKVSGRREEEGEKIYTSGLRMEPWGTLMYKG